MFLTNNYLSSRGLYKQLTVFCHTSLWGVLLTRYVWYLIIVSIVSCQRLDSS